MKRKIRKCERMKKNGLSDPVNPSTNPRVSSQKANLTREDQSLYHEVNRECEVRYKWSLCKKLFLLKPQNGKILFI
jgi:hypothetical protein